jgi:ATP-dependent DNA ligase
MAGSTNSTRTSDAQKTRPDYAELRWVNRHAAVSPTGPCGLVLDSTLWLTPQLVAQFEYVEWTPDNHLRHTKFVALREDKKARDVRRQ